MFLSSRKKEVPRYLRASIGSCHDLCKYGKKHTLEDKEKPWPHTFETKKVMVGNRRHASFDACEIIKKEIVKQETSMDSLQMRKTKKTTVLKPVSESQISRNAATRKSKESRSSHDLPGEGKDIGVKIKKDGSSKFAMKLVTPRGLVSPKPLVRGGENSSHRKSLSLNDSYSWPNLKPRDVQQIVYPVEEKILHVVEVEIEKKLSEHDQVQSFVVQPFHHHPLSSPTQEEHCEYKVSEEEYEYSSMRKESENAEEESNKNLRARNEGESPDETQNLHFKRGTVLNLKPEDDQGMTSLKQRGNDDSEVTDDDDNNTNEGKGLLRHQDVQDKEDTPRLLFNNVIEETAGELVKARNSKVKALVEAFETIISLQKFNPSVRFTI